MINNYSGLCCGIFIAIAAFSIGLLISYQQLEYKTIIKGADSGRL